MFIYLDENLIVALFHVACRMQEHSESIQGETHVNKNQVITQHPLKIGVL